MNIKELAEAIVSAKSYTNRFDYDHYPEDFETLRKMVQPFFDELKARTDSNTPDAAELIVALEEEWRELPRRGREDTAYRIKLILALYFSPAAVKHSEPAVRFADELRRQWNDRYPKNRYEMGDYETIIQGFDATLLGIPLRKSKRRV